MKERNITGRRKSVLFLAGILCLGAALVSFAQEPVTLTLTTNVVVQDVNRFGVNISDSYYGAPILKYRAQKNYEGMVYRQMVKGILYTNGFLAYDGSSNTIFNNGWAALYTNSAVFELVSGQARGLTGRIVSVSTRLTDVWNNGKPFYAMFYEFNTPVNLGTNANIRDMGIRIEDLSRTGEGYIGDNAYRLVNITAAADNPPGVYGVSCAQMNGGTTNTSILRFDTFYTNLASVSGNWNLHFWVRKVSGTPGVKLSPDSMSGETFTTNFVPSTNWQKMELLMPLNKANSLKIQTTGGVVRIDHVELWKAGYTNPTAFTDDFVDYMRRLQPGTLRFVKMGGNTVSNWINDPIRRQAGRFYMYSKTGPYSGEDDPETGFHSLIGLCDYIGAEPWLCIPGAVTPSEVTLLTDYLAGSTNTAGGRIRAQLGRVQPWTETVRHIHIEFGNEAWNTYAAYAYAGYNGADFWRELIAAGKSTPSYTNNILFHTAGQNFSSSMATRILNDATNSDRFAIAPYMIHDINPVTFPFAAGDYAAQFKWFMGYPLYQIFESGMVAQSNVMKQTGVEYSIYEFNYHAVTVSPTDNVSQVNTFMPSICHGLSTANSMLAMLKRYKMRTQTFFTLSQETYQDVKLWGNTLSFKKGAERSRPAFLAQEGVNRALHGNLLQTSFSTNPPFASYGVFASTPETRTYDSLYSYAFRDGTTNRLVLFNYDLTNTQTVRMVLSDYVKNSTANQWILSAPAYTNNNEKNLSSPQVVPSTGTVVFTSGTEIALAPFSMQVLEWEAAGILPQPVVSTNRLTVPEGGTAGLTVRLSSQPQSAVTVSVARVSGDTDITVQSGATLIFNSGNWSTPQTVTLAAAEDADTENSTAVIRCSSPGMNSIDVTATEGENDLGMIVSTNAVTVPENSTAAFQIKLSKDPGGSLTVSVVRTSGDTNITVQSGATLIFNSGNWPVNQTVTLAAADDPDVENGTATIACTASGAVTKNIAATERDDDTLNLIVAPRFIMVPEAGTAAFTVKLSAIPPENSTVQVVRVSGDSDLTVLSGAYLVFGPSNWSANQTVTLSAGADTDSLNGEALFRCQPQFLNTTGTQDVLAVERDNGSTAVSFQEGTSGYTGTADSYLSSNSKDSNYGATGNGFIENVRLPVVAWNLTSLGSTATVRSADITLTLAFTTGTGNNTSSFDLTVYELKQPWVEGNGSTGVTWNTTDGTTAWQVAGAQGANDRGALVGTVRIPEPQNTTNQEPVIINLNEAGVAYIQACITNPAGNFGFIFDNEDNNQRRACSLSEVSTVSRRPKLAVYYTSSTDPVLLTAPSALQVPEGSTGTFQVKLSRLPPASVTVAVARVSGDTDITVQSGASLLFTTNSWNSYQTVTLAAAEDADDTNSTAVIRCSSSGLANADVTATENDNDDRTPPALTGAAAMSARTVLAQFSEPVAETGAENTANYAINNGITVLLAVRDAADPRIVRLNVSALSIASYTLSVSNVTDLTGNPMPLNSKIFAYSVGPVVFFSEPLNSGPGWITTGDWAFGVPQGLGGASGDPDPAAGYTGTNVYGNNLNGDYANSITVTNTLTTTAIDCSGYTNIILSFRRWLGVEQSAYDHANLQVSTNGTAWLNVWANTTTSLDGGSWTNVSYNLSAVADRKTTLYIRWGLGKTDSSVVYCGWNIDDIQLTGTAVGGGSGSGNGDTDGDQIVDWWEELYFGGATNANPSATAANGRNTVLQTYVAGLDPTNPNAAFLTSILRPLTSGNTLRWQGVSGRVYNVYWSSNLLNGFQSLATNIPWTGNIFTDAVHGTAGQGFYRIEVKLQP